MSQKIIAIFSFHFFHSLHVIRVEKIMIISFLQIVAVLTNICAGSRKVTLKVVTPEEVNTPKVGKNCRFCLFECRKMDSFFKVFKIQLFSEVLYIGHVAKFYNEI